MLRRHRRRIRPNPRTFEVFPVDSCGCEAGARFLAVALVGSAIWYGRQYLVAGLPLRTGAFRVIFISAAAAAAGKIVGLLLYRLRPRR